MRRHYEQLQAEAGIKGSANITADTAPPVKHDEGMPLQAERQAEVENTGIGGRMEKKTPEADSINEDGTERSHYSNIPDSSKVGEGKNFTKTQKNKIIAQNMDNNNGVVKSDLSGEVLVKPQKNTSGVTPDPLEWQIDHIKPKNKGGSNNFSNAQVLSRKENRMKSDK